MFEWEKYLKVKLEAAIEEAVTQIDDEFMQQEHRAVFPYVSDQTFRIMADAAITVLKAVEDAQEFLREDDQLRQ